MNYNHNLHHRHSIRLSGYDYSQAGAYFITICTHDRSSIFGEIVDGEMINNNLGYIVRSRWDNLSKHHQNVELDESVIMPNHLHGIIALHTTPSESSTPISEIIRGFKTFSARQINKIRDCRGVPVWQRNYYERIIRTEQELNNVKNYIINNPTHWDTDTNNTK
jgi:putative transposase